MSEKVRAYLHAHGIDLEPTELDALVVEAVETLPRFLRSEPRSELTAAEAEALERVGFDVRGVPAGAPDAIAQAAAETAALLGDSLDSSQVAERLGVHASRVRQRLVERTLHGIRSRDRWRIPAWQFEGGELLPGLADVLPHLPPSMHPLGVHAWFAEAKPDLPVPDELEERLGERRLSPREWLLLGLPVEDVARLARDTFGSTGAGEPTAGWSSVGSRARVERVR